MTPTTEPLLIVNADDFGLTTGVSQAILRAGDDGIVTSTSALANGGALDGCAPALRDSALGVGAHLALVGEQGPVLSAREIPTLVDAQGRLARGWRPFLARCARGRIDREDVRREFGAQIERLRSYGLALTHLDTHQNLHLWPSIAEVTIGVARSHDVAAIRVTRSAGRSPIALGVRTFAAQLERKARRAAVRFPAATAGFDEAGRLDLDRLRGAITRFAHHAVPSAELVTHPSEAGDAELAALGWDYRGHDELDALVSTDARDAVEGAGFRLGTFADLASAQPVRPQTSR
jgi:predicted glycoside hydrolase/deacetylase ChbG (UPF0249 family)